MNIQSTCIDNEKEIWTLQVSAEVKLKSKLEATELTKINNKDVKNNAHWLCSGVFAFKFEHIL